MTELELQNRCCTIAGCAGIDCLHIPNESGTADRRALGMRKGVPDLLLIGKSVMFVELKRNEQLQASPEQQVFLTTLKKHNVLSKLVGSEGQFRMAMRQVIKERRSSRTGVPLDLSGTYDKYKSAPEKIYRFFMDKQGQYSPNELFAIKLFAKQGSEFPWLCNIKDRYFVATKPSRITSRLLLAGWDVVFV